jgi:hypothetical protein
MKAPVIRWAYLLSAVWSIIEFVSIIVMREVLIPVPARFKKWLCGRSLARIVGSNPAGGNGCLPRVSVVCCQAEVSATGR